jgi:hypothetical protein
MLSLGAYAEAPKYSYAEISYGFFDLPDDDEFDKGAGGAIAGSYGFDSFQIFGQWGTSSLDFMEEVSPGLTETSSLDIDEWFLGGGWHGTLGEPADLVIDFGYLNTKFGGDLDTDEKTRLGGYFADIGFRWRIVKVFEINAFATYANLDNPIGASTIYELNALGYIGRVVVGVGYAQRDWQRDDVFEEDAKWNVGTVFVRYNFGKN